MTTLSETGHQDQPQNLDSAHMGSSTPVQDQRAFIVQCPIFIYRLNINAIEMDSQKYDSL